MAIRDTIKALFGAQAKTYDPRQFLGARTLHDSSRELKSPYSQLPIIYAVIAAISSRLSRIPWKFYRVGTENEAPRHPAIDLLRTPAPGMTLGDLIQALVVHKEITGEWFLYKDPETRQENVPIALWLYHRQQYEPLMRDGAWLGWKIYPDKGRTNTINATRDEVIFDRYYKPGDRLRGMSRLEPLHLGLETEWQARLYNEAFFRNDATPSIIYRVPEDSRVDDATRKRLEQRFIAERQGRKAFEPMILNGGIEPVFPPMTHRDIQFTEQFRHMVSDVCAVFGVDPAIIGHHEHSKYATEKEARRYFWTDVLIPYAESIQAKLNQFLSQWGLEARYDVSGVEALQFAWLERVNVIPILRDAGYTSNEINARLRLGFEEAPWRDEPKPEPQPLMLDERPEVTKQAESTEALADLKEAKRTAAWKKITNGVNPIVGDMRKQIRGFFHGYKQQLLGRIVERDNKTGQVKSVRKDIVDDAADSLNEDKLARIFLTFATTGAEFGYRNFAGQSFNQTPEQITALAAERAKDSKVVADTLRSDVQEVLEDALRQGAEQGLSEAQIAENLTSALDDAIKRANSRAATIARTAVFGAFSAGRQTAILETEPQRLMWISSRDDRVRDSHRALDGEVIGPGGRFRNGLSYPHDKSAPIPDRQKASEEINCRCIVVPLYEGETEADALG